MNKIILILSLVVGLPCLAQIPENQPNDSKIIEFFEKQLQNSQSYAWKGLNWQAAPIIISLPEGRLYAFNFTTKDSRWKEISKSNAKPSVLYAEKDHWGISHYKMQPWMEIEGQAAFVLQMNFIAGVERDLFVFAHERFHRHQMEHFKSIRSSREYLDHLNVENLTLMRLEEDLLRAFVKSQDKQEKLQFLQDFNAVHQSRYALIESDSKVWEENQMRMEGMADYVASRLNGGADYLPIEKLDSDEPFIDKAIKWRYYFVGAAIGYALDFLEVNEWQTAVENGAELSEHLKRALPQDDHASRLEKVKHNFNFTARQQQIGQTVTDYLTLIQNLHQSYDAQPGIRFFLDHPPNMGISGGGSSDNNYFLSDGSTVHLNDASVNASTDGHWKLETFTAPYFFKHTNGLKEIKIPHTCSITLNNTPIHLPTLLSSPPREYPFNELTLTSDVIELSSHDHAGSLVTDGDTVLIRYMR